MSVIVPTRVKTVSFSRSMHRKAVTIRLELSVPRCLLQNSIKNNLSRFLLL